MSIFDLNAALERAAQRFGSSTRRRRADAGRSRLRPPVERRLRVLLGGHERPRIRDIQRDLGKLCARLDTPAPSRATIYNAIDRCPSAGYVARELPDEVRRTLHNVDLEGEVSGAQIAFASFNYGDMRAVSWASGMPWLALHQAARIRGWRPRSLGLLYAVMQRRRLQVP